MSTVANHTRRLMLLLLATLLTLPLLGQSPSPGPSRVASLIASTQPTSQPAYSAAPSWISTLPSGAKIAIISVEGVIYDFTLESLKRRCDRATRAGAGVIVIEIDTPGGVVTSALKISQHLKSLRVPTVAWVRNQAYSAGILISSSADAIVMSPVSRAGDCAPISPGQNLSPTERAKALSPILAEFRDSAQRTGCDYAVYEAMCVLDTELYLVENRLTLTRRIVNQTDYAVMVLGQTSAAAFQAAQAANPILGALAAQGLANAPSTTTGGYAPGSLVSDAERGRWTLIKKLHDGRTLLTVNQAEAMDLGISRGIVRDEQDMVSFLHGSSYFRLDPTWSEGAASWLTWAPIRAALLVLFCVGFYVEVQLPGLVFPGAMAVIALVLLLAAPLIIGLAETWHILLFVVGLILFMLELVPPPTFGLLALSGIIMMFIGLVLAIVPAGGNSALPPHEVNDLLVQSVLWTLLGIFGSGIAFYFITRHFGHIPGLSNLVLRTPPSTGPVFLDTPGSATLTPLTVSGAEVLGQGRIALNDTGSTVTGLRPSGRAKFGELIVDVVSVGGWIDAGKPVRVIEIAGNRIVVDSVQS
jgi:membrane-bound serine protease (ClpP class)